jgi:hypothetical protein
MAASVLAGLIAAGGAEAARRRRRRGGGAGPGTVPPRAATPTGDAEERERAVLDLLSTGDPARLVVFTLRRARGYAEQARRRLPATTEAGPGAGRRRQATELARLDEALDRFRVSGVPADDLVAVRRLERWAAELAASTAPTAGDTSPA